MYPPVASYASHFSEHQHPTSAALLGALVMVGVGEMVGSNAGRDFNAFLIRMIPALVPVWLGILVILLVLFRRELHFSGDTHRGLDLDESKAIKGAHVLRRVLWAMTVVLGPFFIHHQPVATRSDVHAALAV